MIRITLLLSLCLSSFTAVAQMRIIPHVTRAGGDFTTNCLLINPTASQLDYRLIPYEENGRAMDAISGSLAAGETRNIDTVTLFGGDISHFRIADGSELEMTIAYRDAGETASSAHLEPQTQMAQRFLIVPGEGDDVVDGLAIVNLDDQTQTIYVRQVDGDNNELARVNIAELDSNAKELYLFQDFVNTPGAHYEVFSEGMLTLTALRFATGSARYFWETAAIPLPALEEEMTDPRVGLVANFPPNGTYGVSGQAMITDERTITLQNFSYNGSGPDVRIYLGTNGDYANGIDISGEISGTVYSNQTVDIQLPDGVTLDDFDGISVWCTIFLIDFSSGTFQ